jgi:hypothetical protein
LLAVYAGTSFNTRSSGTARLVADCDGGDAPRLMSELSDRADEDLWRVDVIVSSASLYKT